MKERETRADGGMQIPFLRRLMNWLSPHRWENYATEGPYDDGSYWNYWKCKRCGEMRIGPKRHLDTDNVSEGGQT